MSLEKPIKFLYACFSALRRRKIFSVFERASENRSQAIVIRNKTSKNLFSSPRILRETQSNIVIDSTNIKKVEAFEILWRILQNNFKELSWKVLPWRVFWFHSDRSSILWLYVFKCVWQMFNEEKKSCLILSWEMWMCVKERKILSCSLSQYFTVEVKVAKTHFDPSKIEVPN